MDADLDLLLAGDGDLDLLSLSRLFSSISMSNRRLLGGVSDLDLERDLDRERDLDLECDRDDL